MSKKKYELDMLYASIDHKARQAALASKVKLTEKMVENTVITDQEFQQAKREYLEAKKEFGVLQAGREAFIQRKEMLISLGANYRAEGNADPVLLQEKAKQKAAQKAAERSRVDAAKTKTAPKKKPVKQPVKRQPVQS